MADPGQRLILLSLLRGIGFSGNAEPLDKVNHVAKQRFWPKVIRFYIYFLK